MPDGYDNIVWMCLALILLGGGGLFISWYLRRKLMNPKDDSPAGGFSLDALRKLHKEGKMSDAEYESTKALLVNLQGKQAMAQPTAKLQNPASSTPKLK